MKVTFSPAGKNSEYMPLIYGLRLHERYVYHYTKFATARDFILPSNILRLGHFTKTNDPRESRQWQFGVGSIARDKDIGPYALQNVSEWMSSVIQRETRIACFCRDAGPLTGNHLDDIYRRGFARARMWAQYAEDHRGLCLVFDLVKLVEALRRKVEEVARTAPVFLVYSPVSYSNQRLAGPSHEHAFSVTVEDLEELGRNNYPWHHAMRWWRELFFQKVEDWRDEAEWRVIVLVASDGPIDVDTGDALVGVIHGDRMARQDSESIIALSDRPEVEHMGLIWKNGCPWYDLGGDRWSYHDRHLPGLKRK